MYQQTSTHPMLLQGHEASNPNMRLVAPRPVYFNQTRETTALGYINQPNMSLPPPPHVPTLQSTETLESSECPDSPSKKKTYSTLTLSQLDPGEIERFTNPHMTRKEIEGVIGFRPRNLDMYRRAFVHKSILRILKLLPREDVPGYMFESNERLEFVGDAVLSNITAFYLYNKFPNRDEGFLTKTRSKLVDTKALSTYARKKDLGKHMLMSRHLIQMNGKDRDKMLENVMEALIGAIYIDLGLEHATRFVHNLFDNLTNWDAVLKDTNYKDQILRWCQTRGMDLPVYEITKMEGPPHDRTFEMKVVVGGQTLGTGSGKKKTDAEQKAAQQGISALKRDANENDLGSSIESLDSTDYSPEDSPSTSLSGSFEQLSGWS